LDVEEESFVSPTQNKCMPCRKEYARKHYIEVSAARKKAKYDANPATKLAYQKQYYSDNKEDVEEYRKEYYQENRAEIIAKQMARDAGRKPEIAAYQKQYRQDNKKKLRDQKKVREKGSIKKKIRLSISNAIYQALRVVGKTKEGNRSFQALGYFPETLKEHIEKQFSYQENLTPDGKVWMTWDNWGSYNPKTWVDNDYSTHTWNIDHIIPQSDFVITDIHDESVKECWALTNLRPYCAKKNVYDGSNKLRHIKKIK
jgi:hypothetical protein